MIFKINVTEKRILKFRLETGRQSEATNVKVGRCRQLLANCVTAAGDAARLRRQGGGVRLGWRDLGLQSGPKDVRGQGSNGRAGYR